MKSSRTHTFRALYAALPGDVRKQARACYRLFKRNPHHPSLQFKRVHARQPLYSVRVGIGYRALGIRENEDRIVWVWIGSHSEYDKLLNR